MSLQHHHIEDKEDRCPIFTKSPQQWMELVGKKVQILSKTGQHMTGHVYTIDPVSEAIWIVGNLGGDGQVSSEIVMPEAIEDIAIISNATPEISAKLNALFSSPLTPSLSQSELLTRKAQLLNWLQKNRIPIAETPGNPDVLSISDVLFIHPPYNEEDCRSCNELVLVRVRKLISNFKK